MRWSYDGTGDSLYVRLFDGAPVRQEELEDGTIADFDDNGQLLGVEILSVGSAPWDPESVIERFVLPPDEANALRLLVFTRSLGSAAEKHPPAQAESSTVGELDFAQTGRGSTNA